MQIIRIEVEDFGVFRGKNVFNVKPQETENQVKPIILFGGKNGAGKTTLFEAVKLCLYGINFHGRRMQRSNYHKYIQQHLHHAFEDIPATSASVSVEFNYAQTGHVDTYLIKRSWSYKTQIVESLEIYRNGSRLEEINEDLWQDFLIELIPLGVSKLFFFDGEQIQNLAEEEADNNYLVSSMNSLLGLDLVEGLQNDLKIYLFRKAKEEDKGSDIELSQYESEKKQLEEKVDKAFQSKAQLQSQIDRVRSEIEQQEYKIASEGGGFANKREELKIRDKNLEEEIRSCKDQIRNLCSELLPFAFIPQLCISLRERLINEEKYEQNNATQKIFGSALKNFKKDIQDKQFWKELNISLTDIKKTSKKIVEVLKKDTNLLDADSIEIIHNLSARDRNKLLDMTDQILNHVPKSLEQLTINLRKLVKQKQDVKESLYRVPADDVLKPMIQKLTALNEELSILQQKHLGLEEEIKKDNFGIKQITSKIEKEIEEKTRLERLSQRMTLAKNVQEVLREYTDRLRQDKIKSFSDSFLECFKSLSNKKHLIEKIETDPDSFSINLWGRNSQIIKKSQLSAGEKQIYAIAMLWALARTSGRPLPFIIDTPLGRLDVEHRDNLVADFFPHASHQIIIFSTDAEIDQQYFKKLQPYIAQAYHLNYDERAGLTLTSVGYFWSNEKRT